MKLFKTHTFLKSIITFVFTVLFLSNCKHDKPDKVTIQLAKTSVGLILEQMKSQVYTTAHNSPLKLTLTDTLKFKKFTDDKIVEFSSFLWIFYLPYSIHHAVSN